MRKWTLIFVRFLIRNFQTFGYVSYFWIWFFCVYNILPLRFYPIFFLILRYNCRKIFIPWTTLFRAISSLFSLRKICTLCKKFVTIYKQKKFWLQIFSLFKLLSHHQIPPGRVYNTLHSLATWIEWTGEKVYNRLLERPAQMLGCKFFNRRPMPTFWTYFCFTISAISAQFSMFCLYRLTFSALANQIRPSLRRFCICCHTVALCVSSFHCLCHSRELTFDIAQRIHRINRAYFRWSHS